MDILYRVEAKGIQEWILGSDRLLELKGGSAIVDGLAVHARELAGLCDGNVVSAAAGAVEIAFTSVDDLTRFASVWPAIVEARAPGLPLVQGWASAEGDPKEVRARLVKALARSRNDPSPALPEAGPFVARSGRTGLPAVRPLGPADGKADGLADPAVDRKLAAGRATGDTMGDLAPKGWSFVDDHEQLGEGYLAVVHADGNGVGRVVTELAGPSELREFSEALTEATRAAARTAFALLASWAEEEGGRSRTLRARPVVLGGDDLTALLDARWAVPFAAGFLDAFARETRARPAIRGEEGLTACAGVAIVKTGFPFHAAHDLAESLCKAAKVGSKRPDERTASGLLFHRVTTANPDTHWAELCAGELRGWHLDQGERKPAVLSAGPYDLAGLAALSRLAMAVVGLPRGSVREWLRLAAEDPERAPARWRRLREVADPAALTALDDALDTLAHDPQSGWHVGTPSVTALLDAANLARLEPRADRLQARLPDVD